MHVCRDLIYNIPTKQRMCRTCVSRSSMMNLAVFISGPVRQTHCIIVLVKGNTKIILTFFLMTLVRLPMRCLRPHGSRHLRKISTHFHSKDGSPEGQLINASNHKPTVEIMSELHPEMSTGVKKNIGMFSTAPTSYTITSEILLNPLSSNRSLNNQYLHSPIEKQSSSQ